MEQATTAANAAGTSASPNVSEITYTAEPNIDIAKVTGSNQFKDWLARVDRTRFTIRSIHIQSVDMFGPVKIGFIKFKADVVDSTGKFVAGIVFMRGGSVAIITVLHCDGKDYAVMTMQPRICTGNFQFMEMPAGMLDGSGNFAGVAATEMKQELGFEIGDGDLTSLSDLTGNPNGIYLTPGGSEETMRFFLYEKDVTQAEMDEMNGRLGGEISEGEQITLKIIPFEDLWKVADAKTVVAYTYYQKTRAKRYQADLSRQQ
jgi:ADP-sugar diphosphatase